MLAISRVVALVAIASAVTVIAAPVTAASASKGPSLPPGLKVGKKPKHGQPPGEDVNTVLPDPVEPPVELSPIDDAPDGGITPSFVTSPRRYTVSITNGWGSIRARPNSWFIGSIANGWTLNAFNPPSPDPGSRLGYFFERNFCGWVLNQNLINNNTTGTSACNSNWTLAVKDFTQIINCDTCNGGYLTHLTGYTCYVRNAYPWWAGPDYPPGQPLDFTVCNNAGTPVYWRYISENGQWAAISDPQYSFKWFFVPTQALPSTICSQGVHYSTTEPGALSCGA